jgi:2-aminoadipate transaminase
MIDYDAFLSPTGRHLHESAIRRMGTVAAEAPGLISFAAGYPDPTAFPWEELRQIACELLDGREASVLQYGPTRGSRLLLDILVDVLSRRGIDVDPSEIAITTGSQQGIDLVARVLVGPGDGVLVELPAYTGAISAFKNVQAELIGVPQAADGIDVDALDATCLRARSAGRRVNLLYLVPNFQNPTGLLLSLGKRQQLVEWAARRNMLIIEDDPYGALYFDDLATEAETRPIRADDPHGRVIYLSSFSKTLAPGFRVGWMTAPAELVGRFETAKQSLDLTSGSLDQRVVFEALRRGIIERIEPSLRRLYRKKRDLMEKALRQQCGSQLSWLVPKGGFFVWATLPDGCTDNALLDCAFEHGMIFVAGSAFYVDGTGHDRIRLSFSAPDEARIREGAARLSRAVHATVGGRAAPEAAPRSAR